MKKIKFIPVGLLGLSLAFGLVTFAKAPEKAKPVHADPEHPEIFRIGGHNLLENHTCDEYGGTAVLSEEGGEYVLTLTNFNNNNVVWEVTREEEDEKYTNCVLAYHNPTKNLRIKVNGTCTFSNQTTMIPSKSTTPYDYCYGLFIATQFNEAANVTIEGVEGTNPVLNIQSPSYAGESSAINFTSVKAGTNSTLSISNCEVNATAGAGKTSYAIECIQSNLEVLEGANINAITGGVNATDENTHETAAIYVDAYRQTGGKVVATAGNATKASQTIGLKANKGHVYVENGELIARGGTATKYRTCGIYVTAGALQMDAGAIVTAIGGNITEFVAGGFSMGVYVQNYSSNKTEFRNNALYFYAAAKYSGSDGRAVYLYINSVIDGYKSNSDIYSASTPGKITAGASISDGYTNKEVLFAKSVAFEVSVTSNVTYDGNAHEALELNIKSPANCTVSYKVGDDGEWVSDVPSFTNANESGYVVYYKIHSKFFASDVQGSVNFKILKANAVVIAPKLVKNFKADGNDHKLVTAGQTEQGTIWYSVNDGAYSVNIPTAKDAGEYKVSYKVVGDQNHKDVAPVSLGKVVVSGRGGSGGGSSGKSSGISGGAVAGIVIGSLVFVIGAAYLVLFFLLNKWIKVGDKAVRVMRFALGSKDGKERYLSFKCKFEYRDKSEVFNTKDEALK